MIKRFLEQLAKSYELIIRTEYHVQIACTRGYHNIWFSKDGTIKMRLCGNRTLQYIRNVEQARKLLSKYKYENSDLSMMNEIKSLIKLAEGKFGVFVDAGFKNNLAQLGVYRTYKLGKYDINVLTLNCESSNDAEIEAILFAMKLYPGEMIYSDCKGAVEKVNSEFVKWISREVNVKADALSNLRGKSL